MASTSTRRSYTDISDPRALGEKSDHDNLPCQPQDNDHTHLRQVNPIASSSRTVDEEVGILRVVHEEERQSELFSGGDEVEEHITYRYAGAVFP